MKKIIWICLLLAVPVVGFFGYRLTHPILHMHFVFRPTLLMDEQVDYVRAHPDEAPLCLTGRELYMKHVNFVLQIQNEGEIYTAGSLFLRAEGTEEWHEIWVSELAPKNSKNGMSSQEYIIPLGIQDFSQSDQPIHIDVDAYKMRISNHPGSCFKKRRFAPHFRYECYLHADRQTEHVGDVSF